MSTPRRAVVLTAEIQADSLHDLASTLLNLATQIEVGELTGPVIISGGHSSGYILHLAKDPTQTHDAWAEQLRAHLDALRSDA